MEINFVAAVIAGFLGTAVMTSMMLYGKHLNLPAVDAHGILGFMLNEEKAGPIGYIMHFALGAGLAIGYAVVFTFLPTMNLVILGGALGIIHWLAVGWMFAFAPMVHAGMQAGTVEETGPYMLKSLGVPGFVAGLVGHIVFGMVVGLGYGLFGNF